MSASIHISKPDPSLLLPPFLASLSTSLVSPRPPAPLLPLLSPTLRQKVDILSALPSSIPSSSSDPWIRLLCWNEANATSLQKIIEQSTFEPHPASGEIEVPEHLTIHYKKFDEETLRAQLSLSPDYNLTVVYVWCTGISDDGGAAWKVTELLPGDCQEANSDTWFPSIAQAVDGYEVQLKDQGGRIQSKILTRAMHDTPIHNEDLAGGGDDHDDDDEDDDYWAMYDHHGGETPAQPGVDATSARKNNPALADSGYYEQYDHVQPALDSDDPSVNANDLGKSTMNGDLLASMLRKHAELFPTVEEGEEEQELPEEKYQTASEEPEQRTLFPDTIKSPNHQDEKGLQIDHPRPSISSGRSSTSAISKLEETAETHWAAENAIKQHVSSSIRSLFRLAKSTGMSSSEFKSFINEEMEGLRSDSE
ncbi:hypothetical protein KEM54_004736 [Ascosphaera aggregata]|nr:hypothetical protein KEM54_004736 [Ascosphaera aggregata]